MSKSKKPKPVSRPDMGKTVKNADGESENVLLQRFVEIFPLCPFQQGQTDARYPILVFRKDIETCNHFFKISQQRPLTKKECKEWERAGNKVARGDPLTMEDLNFILELVGSVSLDEIAAFLMKSYPFFTQAGLNTLTWYNILTSLRRIQGRRIRELQANLASKQEKGKKPSKLDYQHSEDYTSVAWFGERYQFTKTQALCVKHLWAEWEKSEGLSLSEKTIGEKIGSAADNYKLKHTFRVKRNNKSRQHPAWGKMIVSSGKGMFCLKSSRKK